VDEVTGNTVGLDQYTRYVMTFKNDCAFEQPPGHASWLEEFRAGAAP
jgi:hypothetical protein